MEYETVEVSDCCHADLVEGYKNNPRDHHDPIEIYTCSKCGKECEVEEVCAFCRGEGEVTTMEQVYPNEPHYADVGTRKCVCQIKDDDE